MTISTTNVAVASVDVVGAPSAPLYATLPVPSTNDANTSIVNHAASIAYPAVPVDEPADLLDEALLTSLSSWATVRKSDDNKRLAVASE